MALNLISNINKDIIQWCCDEVSITFADLAAGTHIPEHKLRATILTFNQLDKIADYFGYDLLFFLAPKLPQIDRIHSVAFHTLANQEIPFDSNIKKIVEQVESHRDLYLYLLEDLGEEHHLHLPKLSGSVTDKAQTIRKWLNIETDQSYDFDKYRRSIESKGILVFQSIGYAGKWQVKNKALIGFSINHDITPAIFVKKTSPQQQTFTMFHELGHLLLHHNSFIDDQDSLKHDHHSENEREANQFATQCLLPEKFSEKFTSDRKLIPRTCRYQEPVHIFGNAYVQTVLDSLNSNQITLNKASGYLDRLKIADIKKLSSHYA